VARMRALSFARTSSSQYVGKLSLYRELRVLAGPDTPLKAYADTLECRTQPLDRLAPGRTRSICLYIKDGRKAFD